MEPVSLQHGGKDLRRSDRLEARIKIPEACRRHGAADAFKAGQHNRALRRTWQIEVCTL